MPGETSETGTHRRPDLLKPVRAAVDWTAGSPWRAFVIIFLIGFAIRLVFLTTISTRWVLPPTGPGVQAIAASLVQFGKFADPFAIPTGPTAYLPPLVPGLLALIWRVFGMTLVGGYAAWVIRLACQSAMCAMLPWFAGKLGISRQAGVIGGLVGALLVRRPGHFEELAAIVLLLLLVVFLRRWTGAPRSPGRSLLVGLAWGVGFHIQPALLPVLLGCMVFELWWRRGRRQWVHSAAMALGVTLACLPWGGRNYVVFHEVFFIRSNLGLELRMGNFDGAIADLEVLDGQIRWRHPSTHRGEARMVQRLGEVVYMRQAGREALDWMRSNPGTFAALTASRVVHFWFGPVVHRRWTAAAVTALTVLAVLGAWWSRGVLAPPQWAVLLIPLATYPLIYYIVFYMFRYRIPINGILLLLAGAAVWFWIERLRRPVSTG
ncbi:MAG: hypothetical protein ACYTF4_15585 [Planctomycetota bacterium]|jgi:hypothetical protein